jgi:hypothetical protein
MRGFVIPAKKSTEWESSAGAVVLGWFPLNALTRSRE